MAKKILNGKLTGELGEKRFYFKGKISIKCTKCKSRLTRDFEDDYLSYPVIDEESELTFCCDDCDREYSIPFKLKAVNIIAEYDDSSVKLEEDWSDESDESDE